MTFVTLVLFLLCGSVLASGPNITLVDLVETVVSKDLPGSYCEEIKKWKAKSGVFLYRLPNTGISEHYCDMETDGGGWTVIQRRVDGAVNFSRGWYSYKHGFGEKQNEFWLGLEKLYLMTRNNQYEVRVDLILKDGTPMYAKYSNFKIGPESTNYRLTVSGYSGNATDGLSIYNNASFTTKDAPDPHFWNCPLLVASKNWWYQAGLNSLIGDREGGCYQSNLNGNYWRPDWHGMFWRRHSLLRGKINLSFSEMKIRLYDIPGSGSG